MAARKKKSLVIVESPAKAKTINKYLGTDYEVVASKGHVRDLIKSRLGIDIEKGWIPNYRVSADRKEVSWPSQEARGRRRHRLPGSRPGPRGRGHRLAPEGIAKLDDKRISRVTFNEITKNAVQKAFASAGTSTWIWSPPRKPAVSSTASSATSSARWSASDWPIRT